MLVNVQHLKWSNKPNEEKTFSLVNVLVYMFVVNHLGDKSQS